MHSLVGVYQHLERPDALIFRVEDRGSTFFRNTGKHLADIIVTHPRRRTVLTILKFMRAFSYKLHKTFVAEHLEHRRPVPLKNGLIALSVILIWLKGTESRKSKCPKVAGVCFSVSANVCKLLCMHIIKFYKRLTNMRLINFSSNERNISHTIPSTTCSKLPLENKTEIMKQKQMLTII